MTTAKQIDKLNIPWKDINWKLVEREIFRLQRRIYNASQRGEVQNVHNLQKLLTSSYYGRLWATRRVTQDNQGSDTAGIDGQKSLSPKERFKLTSQLKIGKKPKPLRRVWIPKADETKRGLGIPTIYDRALQCLVKLALEPEWEAKFEPNSYGFRPARSCHDAIGAIFNAIRSQPKYVLDADIAKCFDKINHQKLLEKINTYPELKKQVKYWLESGVLEKGILLNTKEGTPQGGVISPLLANIALHGMEIEIKKYAETIKYPKMRLGKSAKRQRLNLIRYADDFVILHERLDVIEECKKIIEKWLTDIGLELKPSKTRISHTLEEVNGNKGFDFLGFTIRQFRVSKNQSGKNTNGKKLGFKTLIKPSKEKIRLHIKKLGEVIHKHKSSKQVALIRELNPIIRGWCNYYSAVCSKETFSKCDHIMYKQLKRWGERRHPNKNKGWVADKYWLTVGENNWKFSTKDGYKLYGHRETPIKRHIKVKGESSLYDGNLKYWATRMGKHPELSTRKAKLLKNQKGECKYCEAYFKEGDLIEIDHIIPKALGGKDEYKNLQLLHRHCHDKKTATDIKKMKEQKRACFHVKEVIREERIEVKVS